MVLEAAGRDPADLRDAPVDLSCPKLAAGREADRHRRVDLIVAGDHEVDWDTREPAELVVAGSDRPLTVFPGERQLADSELSFDAEAAAGAAGLVTSVAVDVLDGRAVEGELAGFEARLERLELPPPAGRARCRLRAARDRLGREARRADDRKTQGACDRGRLRCCSLDAHRPAPFARLPHSPARTPTPGVTARSCPSEARRRHDIR